MKYRAIRDNASRYAVEMMCSALEVSTSRALFVIFSLNRKPKQDYLIP